MTHRTTAVLCVLVLFSNSHAQQTLRIGTWNIEHLGDPKARRGPGEGKLQDHRDLARYIRTANVDALALQEITADEPGPDGFPPRFRTNSVLKKTFAELNKAPGNDWQHVLFPKSKPKDLSQWVGVAWKSGKLKPAGQIYEVKVSHAKSSQDFNMWNRNLHAMMFSAGKGKTDFLVMVVHLKANANGTFAKHRAEEIQDLVKRLPDVQRAFPDEKDWIILGDTNVLQAKETAVDLLEKADFRDLNKDDHDTHTSKGIQPFDRIFVPRGQPEFVRSKVEVMSGFMKQERLSFAEYRARYSDHYMAVTQIQVMNDDD